MPLALEPELPVLALCAVMARPPLLDGVAAELENEIGPVGRRGPVYRFDYTSYYEEEMGGDLCKQVLAFADLVPPHRLAELKGRAMEIERRLGLEDGGRGRRRSANIDPGLLSESSLVLATAKYGRHRIAVAPGLYAEITLLFERGRYRPQPWTYADYRSGEMQAFLLGLRRDLLERRRRERRQPPGQAR